MALIERPFLVLSIGLKEASPIQQPRRYTKDVVVEVSYYSKTKSRISSEQVTIYDVFPPKAVKNFDVKVAAPKATETIGWEVLDAARN
jgi:hypothetical protein